MIKARNQVESSKLLNYDFIKGVLLDSNNYCVYLFNDMEDFSIQELKNISKKVTYDLITFDLDENLRKILQDKISEIEIFKNLSKATITIDKEALDLLINNMPHIIDLFSINYETESLFRIDGVVEEIEETVLTVNLDNYLLIQLIDLYNSNSYKNISATRKDIILESNIKEKVELILTEGSILVKCNSSNTKSLEKILSKKASSIMDVTYYIGQINNSNLNIIDRLISKIFSEEKMTSFGSIALFNNDQALLYFDYESIDVNNSIGI